MLGPRLSKSLASQSTSERYSIGPFVVLRDSELNVRNCKAQRERERVSCEDIFNVTCSRVATRSKNFEFFAESVADAPELLTPYLHHKTTWI